MYNWTLEFGDSRLLERRRGLHQASVGATHERIPPESTLLSWREGRDMGLDGKPTESSEGWERRIGGKESHPVQEYPVSPRMFLSWPKHQEYVWGGEEIATLKGLPPLYHRMRIAETGEISTLGGYQSEVIVNAHTRLSLRSAIGKASIDYMVKYLDCHEDLSIQVHGRPHLDKKLEKRGSADMEGKEESFLVLKRAHGRKVHLILGFERPAVRPLAEAIRPDLERAALTSGHQLDSQLRKIWRTLTHELKALRTGEKFTGRLSDDLARSLGLPRHTSMDEVFESSGNDNVIAILKQHLTGSTNSLPGQEYVFAGVAIVNLISNLHDWILPKIKDGTVDVTKAMKLFGYDQTHKIDAGIECEDVRPIDHPLLRFFHRVRIPAENCWVRVPPGIVHSWQGGGNFLIEIGHRSDVTLRILDYGREFVGPGRPMHYLDAMKALSADGFFDCKADERLITSSEESDCHSLVKCRFLRPNEAGIADGGEPSKQWGFVMNPDGEAAIIAKDGDGNFQSRLTAGRCRTVLIKPDTRVEITPAGQDDRVLYFSAREPVVGQHFGATAKAEDDLLVQTLKRRLTELRIGSDGTLGHQCHVRRSEISTPVEREVEGFVYYRKLLQTANMRRR